MRQQFVTKKTYNSEEMNDAYNCKESQPLITLTSQWQCLLIKFAYSLSQQHRNYYLFLVRALWCVAYAYLSPLNICCSLFINKLALVRQLLLTHSAWASVNILSAHLKCGSFLTQMHCGKVSKILNRQRNIRFCCVEKKWATITGTQWKT